MKTKHLFLATALVASFAACTNEEIVDAQQNNSAVGRPTVENVKLNFVAEGVDSRLTFSGSGYAWEATDTIGALQMDVPGDPSKTAWIEKYKLSKWVNTSYPFTYNAEDKTWSCPGKMLEGNYFFAFPWASYDGERSMTHSLLNQEQNGVKGAVVAENYAKNQLFIGYAQIKKGSAFDVLTDVEMTPVLGAIQLRIVNNSSKELHISKIQLVGTPIASELTFNPTNAVYANYDYTTTVNGSSETWFNYANYVGDDEADMYMDSEYVEDYDREKAIRSVVNKGANSGDVVILNVNGTSEERAIAKNATGYALIMTNEISTVGASSLKAVIITDEGKIEYTIDHTKVKKIASDVSNTVVVKVEDDDIQGTDIANIYVEEDLIQLLNWNINAKAETTLTATLQADIELTKEAIDLLKSNAKLSLVINNDATTEYALTLAEDFPAGALEYKNLTINSATVPVKVAGTYALTKNAKNLKSIQVLEGATLNINEANANVPTSVTVDEEGTLNIGAGVNISNRVTIENNGAATIAATATVQKEFKNNGTLTLNGKVSNLINTGKVTMGEGAVVVTGKNNGSATEHAYIYTAANAKVTITDNANGRIKYVASADITATGGYVFAEIGTAEIDEDTYDETGVNLYILTGGLVEVSESLDMKDLVEVAEGAAVTLKVAEPAADATEDIVLTLKKLNVKKNGNLTTQGKLVVETIEVAEDAEWSNEAGAEVEVSAKISNKGSVYNSGVVKGTAAAVDATNANNLVGVTAVDASNVSKLTSEKWNNNPFEIYGGLTTAEKKAAAMKAAVELWAKNWPTMIKTYYHYNPYNVDDMVKVLDVWNTNNNGQAIEAGSTVTFGKIYKDLADLYVSTTDTDDDNDTLLDALTGTDDETPIADFTTAVNNMLDEVVGVFNAAAFDATTGALNKVDADATAWISESTSAYLYSTRAAAFDAFAKVASEKLCSDATFGAKLETELAKSGNAAVSTKWGNYKLVIASAIYRTADATIETALKATLNTNVDGDYMYYSYVWADATTNVCPIYKVMQVVKNYNRGEWSSLVQSISGAGIPNWTDDAGYIEKVEHVKTLLKYANLYGATGDLLGTLKDMNYFPTCNDWTYATNEVKAAALTEASDAE